jgi:uncharacterized membrane protein
MYRVFLYLHIMGAIVAFGPSFTFPLIGFMMRQEPEHRLFALRTIEVIHHRLIVPVSLTMLVSGGGLAVVTGTSPFTPWLLASLAIYALAFYVGLRIQGPAVARMIELGSRPPEGSGGRAVVAPEVRVLLQRSKLGRHILTVSLFTIVALMVWRPGG